MTGPARSNELAPTRVEDPRAQIRPLSLGVEIAVLAFAWLGIWFVGWMFSLPNWPCMLAAAAFCAWVVYLRWSDRATPAATK